MTTSYAISTRDALKLWFWSQNSKRNLMQTTLWRLIFCYPVGVKPVLRSEAMYLVFRTCVSAQWMTPTPSKGLAAQIKVKIRVIASHRKAIHFQCQQHWRAIEYVISWLKKKNMLANWFVEIQLSKHRKYMDIICGWSRNIECSAVYDGYDVTQNVIESDSLN